LSNSAKAKGTAWETALVRGLAGFFAGRHGLEPRRVAQSGRLDTGDLHGLSPFIAQAKSYRDIVAALREGLEGAEVQKVRAGEPYGVAFVKRPRKPTGEGYAVLTVVTFARLLLRLRRAEAHLERHAPADVWAAHVAATAVEASLPLPTV
jgi:hypothetical protein